jgi:5-methylthioadenosine/S-adenosylhomocysteine deaminase
MPGLINGHIHLWQTALRGVAADWTLDQYFGVLIGVVNCLACWRIQR